MNLKQKSVKQKLEHHYKAFDRSQIEPDPLQFPHLFSDKKDIEVTAFISSVFAYGNVKQIINSLNRFLQIAENEPYYFIKNFNNSDSKKYFIHRFYSEADVRKLFSLLQITYSEYGSLKKLFSAGYNKNQTNLKNAITLFSKYFSFIIIY